MGDEGTIVVEVDENGRAKHIHFFDVDEYSVPADWPSLFGQLRTLLGF